LWDRGIDGQRKRKAKAQAKAQSKKAPFQIFLVLLGVGKIFEYLMGKIHSVVLAIFCAF
jgi:hypothetical protein